VVPAVDCPPSTDQSGGHLANCRPDSCWALMLHPNLAALAVELAAAR